MTIASTPLTTDRAELLARLAQPETYDLLIIGGTSLVVYPAAGLIDYYQGDKLVLINKDKTSKDNRANLILHEPIGEVLKPLV